ncbi:MAG TPA: PAS domain S-box protein [Methanocella sp.]|uniref:PAS domain-containing sensor histidine kinase n=1 Tax=Methanocella sp. TaxID=2052833 RepID=UPI002C663945|nr:PAS domain S-box protein [Methanocella sp.]HTY91742.1 PAS domain S-box protein [Methanocella sp.]
MSSGQKSGAPADSWEENWSLIENFLDLVYVVKPDGAIIFVSPQISQYGYQSEELLSRNIFEFITPDCREYVSRKFEKSLASGESFPTEFKWQGKGGQTFWVEALGRTVYDDARRPLYQVGVIRDISERKQAEEALRNSEEKFHLLADSANVGILLVQDEDIIYINRALAAIAGYTVEECKHLKYWDVMPQEKKEYIRWAGNARQQGWVGPSRSELKVIGKDGREIWLDCSWTVPILGGRPAVIVMCVDITERKRAEEALRESERKFSVLAETSSAAILVYQGKKNLYVNHAAELLSGYTKEELSSIDYFDLIHPDHLEFIKNRAFDLPKGQQVPQRYDVKVKTKSGEEKWVDVSAGFLDFMGSPAGIITAIDITENKRAEAERERLLKEVDEQYARLKAIIDALPVGLFIYDMTGAVLVQNEIAVKIWGGTAPMVKKWNEFDVYKAWRTDTDKSLKNEERATTRALKGETVIGLMLDIQRFDGLYSTILVSSAPMRDSKGSIIGAVVINQDITEIKKMEKELSEARMQAELYLDLMGHDINNMHQIALGYLELAKDTLQGEEQTLLLDKPVEVLKRSTQLIDNVRKLQKLRDGKFQTEDIDIIPLLANLQREFGAFPNKSVILNVNCHEHCLVRANELLLDIYANLITNAIKHTGDKARITLDLDIADNNGVKYCRVAVEDNGPGIPDDKKATIFNRTLKGSNKARGMGLGLYIVKSLVDSYGGKVWVEDRVVGDHTQGARFVVMIPAVEE